MLSIVRPHSRCMCRCLLQAGKTTNNVTQERQAHSPNTHQFKRTHEIGQVAVGKFPLIKRKHQLLEKLPTDPNYKTTMSCILTKEIDGIGLKGTVVEVKKRLFRNVLYPRGEAVYASPENLAYYESFRKDSEEEGIDYQTKQMMKKLSGFHLKVFMNPDVNWELSPDHIRIACRKQNLWVNKENIIPPSIAVTGPGDFTFKLQIDNRIATQVRGTVYAIGPDGLPPVDVELPEEWNNPPIDPDNVIELLKKTQPDSNSS